MGTLKCVVSSVLFAILICISTLSLAATPDRITKPINTGNMVPLKGHVSPLARSKDDQGPIEGNQVLHVTMLFTPSAQQAAVLQQLLADQQDSKSAQFHKWLTAEEFGQQFGLSSNDLSKISAWLKSQGFKVTYAANGHDFLSFDGTASQVQSVFQTSIHNFRVNGKMHFANITPPMIPAALNGIIGGFRGLHDFLPRPMLKKRPAYTYQAQGNSYAALAPGDIATIYDITPLYAQNVDGTGESVVIVGQSDVYIADINYFRTAFGFTDLSGCTLDSQTKTVLQAGTCTTGDFEQVWPNGNDPGLQPGDLGESDLDIEWMNSVARGAKIIFVTSGNGVDDSAAWAVDNQLATVISYSYGLCEAWETAPSIATAELTYQKAATEGISFFAASGDAAAATCDGDNGYYPAQLGPSVSYPASSPNVTGVGGTEFDEGTSTYWTSANGSNGGSALSYIPESAWNDTAASETQGYGYSGSGGGASNCAYGTAYQVVSGPQGTYQFQICDAPPNGGFVKPSWQVGLTPSDGVRDVPDIAFSASNFNDPYIVCAPQSEVVQGSTSSTSTCSNTNDGSHGINTALTTYGSAFGGTSASTPVTAGMAVLLNQYLRADGLGLFNPQLYKVFAANPTGVFHDVDTGSNSITQGLSSNVVACAHGAPSYEPTALQCSNNSFGFTVGGGHTYNQVTGLGSVDMDAFFQAWEAADGSFTLNSPSANVTAGHSTSSIAINLTPSGGFNSQVSFSCPTLPTGVTACTFTPQTLPAGSTSTSLVITTSASMQAGAVTVPISASGGGTTATSSVSLTVAATDQTFTLALQQGSATTFQVVQGASVQVNVVLSGTNGFSTPVLFSCSDQASESTCSGPPSYTTNYTNSNPATFTITTTAPTAKLEKPLNRGGRLFYAAFLPGILGILLTAGSRKRSPRGMRLLGLIFVLTFSTLWMGACSNSTSSANKNPGTPAGQYTISITATTGGQQPISNSGSPLTFTVNVVQ